MQWNGNECGKNKSNENFKTTIPSKNVDRPKQLENVGSFKYLGSLLTNNGRCTCELKCRIPIGKAAFNKKMDLFTSTLDLELRKKLENCCIWNIVLCGAETWTPGSRSETHGKLQMQCWRRMEKISWTDHVRHE
jgi:hypothetical protein